MTYLDLLWVIGSYFQMEDVSPRGFFVTQLFSAGNSGKDCNRESSTIDIRKIVESLFSDGEHRNEKDSSQLGRLITHPSDDI